jgi:hypothetical protein
MKITVLWDVTSCILVEFYRRFDVTCRRYSYILKLAGAGSSEYRQKFARLHDVTSQKTRIFFCYFTAAYLTKLSVAQIT